MKQLSKLDILTVFAIRSDEDKLPIIETIKLYTDADEWGKEIFRPLKKIESRNDLYPYDHLKDRQSIKSNSISECYSKGYVFYTMSDAIRRLELLVDKKEVKVEAELSILADFKNRLAHIRMQNE
jgi:hypothetical protein